MVTLCLPTVTNVPGGSVPAGAGLCGTGVAAEREGTVVRLAEDEECEA